jgi:hypothetical protein
LWCIFTFLGKAFASDFKKEFPASLLECRELMNMLYQFQYKRNNVHEKMKGKKMQQPTLIAPNTEPAHSTSIATGRNQRHAPRCVDGELEWHHSADAQSTTITCLISGHPT